MIAPPEGWPWPAGTAWAARLPLDAAAPPLWPGRAIASGARLGGEGAPKVFHDGGARAVLAPGIGGLALWADGAGFLSCVLDMPEAGVAGLTPRSLVALAGGGALSAPRTLYARLNLRHGPNTTQQTRAAALQAGHLLAEFDLAYLELRHQAITAAWIDLIVEAPGSACLTLTDVTLSHRPRAEL